MTDETRALVELSAAVVSGDRPTLRRTIERAAAAVTATAAEEALLQSHLFAGYPVALQAMALWREHVGRPAVTDLDEDPSIWRARGEAVCALVYGEQYRQLRRNVYALHPELERCMVEEGYGRVLGRPGLSLDVRELCIVALLCSQNAPRQLYSHLRGALNAGASPADVRETVTLATTRLDAVRASDARMVLEDVLGRRERGTEQAGADTGNVEDGQCS